MSLTLINAIKLSEKGKTDKSLINEIPSDFLNFGVFNVWEGLTFHGILLGFQPTLTVTFSKVFSDST